MALPKTPSLTTDCVLFDPDGRVLLIRRKNPPFAGAYALPGGFVEIGETVEQACRREVQEEAGVEPGPLRLIGVYSDPGRDPRGHTVSIAYTTELPAAITPKPGSDAAHAEWVRDWRDCQLAFDHAQIIDAAERMIRRPRPY